MLFETLVGNIKNWYYKVRKLLQNETDNSYQKCDKVRQSFMIKCVRYYEVLQMLLQTASGITKCDSYQKVRRNKGSLRETCFSDRNAAKKDLSLEL